MNSFKRMLICWLLKYIYTLLVHSQHDGYGQISATLSVTSTISSITSYHQLPILLSLSQSILARPQQQQQKKATCMLLHDLHSQQQVAGSILTFFLRKQCGYLFSNR